MGWNRVLATAIASVLAGCVSNDPLVANRTGDQSSAYTVAGHGDPAIVFVSGAGESRLSWSPVFLALATDATVFAYDRPGAGSNPNVPNAFTPDEDGLTSTEEAVEHLRGLLADAGVAPPYVLVGHSLGGSYVLKFAQLHPDDVAGVVMIDARVPALQAQCFIEAPDYPELCRPVALSAAVPAYVRAEIDGNLATETSGPAPEDLGDLPIAFIAAAQTTPRRTPRPAELAEMDPDVAERLRAASPGVFARIGEGFKTAQRNYAEAAANGRFIEVEDAGHHVHQDQPQLVIDEIRALLERIRTE